MKSILFSAAFAMAMAFAATDASAQQVIGKTSSSERPMPTNSEITESTKEIPVTDGKPMEQIRSNETDSPRNRENIEIISSESKIEKNQDETDPATRKTKSESKINSKKKANNSSR